jgi:hypothetical protein
MRIKSDLALGGSQLRLRMHLDPNVGRLQGTHVRSSRQIAWGYQDAMGPGGRYCDAEPVLVHRRDKPVADHSRSS